MSEDYDAQQGWWDSMTPRQKEAYLDRQHAARLARIRERLAVVALPDDLKRQVEHAITLDERLFS